MYHSSVFVVIHSCGLKQKKTQFLVSFFLFQYGKQELSFPHDQAKDAWPNKKGRTTLRRTKDASPNSIPPTYAELRYSICNCTLSHRNQNSLKVFECLGVIQEKQYKCCLLFAFHHRSKNYLYRFYLYIQIYKPNMVLNVLKSLFYS